MVGVVYCTQVIKNLGISFSEEVMRMVQIYRLMFCRSEVNVGEFLNLYIG